MMRAFASTLVIGLVLLSLANASCTPPIELTKRGPMFGPPGVSGDELKLLTTTSNPNLLVGALTLYKEDEVTESVDVVIDLSSGAVTEGSPNATVNEAPQLLEDPTGGYRLRYEDVTAILTDPNDDQVSIDIELYAPSYARLAMHSLYFFVSRKLDRAYVFYVAEIDCTTRMDYAPCAQSPRGIFEEFWAAIVNLSSGQYFFQSFGRGFGVFLEDPGEHNSLHTVYDDIQIAMVHSNIASSGCEGDSYVFYDTNGLVEVNRFGKGLLHSLQKSEKSQDLSAYGIEQSVELVEAENEDLPLAYVSGYSINQVSVISGNVIRQIKLDTSTLYEVAKFDPTSMTVKVNDSTSSVPTKPPLPVLPSQAPTYKPSSRPDTSDESPTPFPTSAMAANSLPTTAPTVSSAVEVAGGQELPQPTAVTTSPTASVTVAPTRRGGTSPPTSFPTIVTERQVVGGTQDFQAATAVPVAGTKSPTPKPAFIFLPIPMPSRLPTPKPALFFLPVSFPSSTMAPVVTPSMESFFSVTAGPTAAPSGNPVVPAQAAQFPSANPTSPSAPTSMPPSAPITKLSSFPSAPTMKPTEFPILAPVRTTTRPLPSLPDGFLLLTSPPTGPAITGQTFDVSPSNKPTSPPARAPSDQPPFSGFFLMTSPPTKLTGSAPVPTAAGMPFDFSPVAPTRIPTPSPPTGFLFLFTAKPVQSPVRPTQETDRESSFMTFPAEAADRPSEEPTRKPEDVPVTTDFIFLTHKPAEETTVEAVEEPSLTRSPLLSPAARTPTVASTLRPSSRNANDTSSALARSFLLCVALTTFAVMNTMNG